MVFGAALLKYKKEIFSWAMYDFGNTIFSALFVSFFFPFYIKHFLNGTEFQIGLVFGISLLLVAVLVPILGNMSDIMKKRIPFIMVFTIICCISTFLVIFGNLYIALFFGLLANFSYHASLSFYNTLLHKIGGQNKGFVSGIGVSIGYMGTLLSLAVAYIILSYLGWETLEGMKAIFIATSILYLCISLFLFFGIKENSKITYRSNLISIKDSVKHIIITIKKIMKEKGLRSFFMSLFFYSNAINAVIIFLFLYAREVIGLNVKGFFPAYALFGISAALGSLIFGRLTDKYGGKKILILNGILWLFVILLLLKIQSYRFFLFAGSTGGFAMGILWTAARPKLINMAPKKKLAEYFGFLELTDKVSGTIGPVVFGFFATFVNYEIALASLILFFVLGLIFLKWVPKD